MKKIAIEYKLYSLTCLILILVLFEVLIPFFNPYWGAYGWWLCLTNVLLMLVYNYWQNNERHQLGNEYGWRNLNLIIGVVVTVMTILVIWIGDSERVYYELTQSAGGNWKRGEVFWDLWVLLFVNGIILSEQPFFEALDQLISSIKN